MFIIIVEGSDGSAVEYVGVFSDPLELMAYAEKNLRKKKWTMANISMKDGSVPF